MSPESLPNPMGRYLLGEEIASGGMASVRLASMRGGAGFARIVAVKQPHAHLLTDRRFVAMFTDEARLCSRIRHPNVVPILDVVDTPSSLFLVMEYVHGVSLAELLTAARAQGERPPPQIVATILCQVLHGLHGAHEATDEAGAPLSIIHRDVSPQNVLVGVDGVARVVDFGVAKALGRVQTTRDGQVKGKIAYMSPEQLCGDELDRCADVFSASVVFWESLTGLRLFRGDNPATVLKRVLEEPILPPSQANPELAAS